MQLSFEASRFVEIGTHGDRDGRPVGDRIQVALENIVEWCAAVGSQLNEKIEKTLLLSAAAAEWQPVFRARASSGTELVATTLAGALFPLSDDFDTVVLVEGRARRVKRRS